LLLFIDVLCVCKGGHVHALQHARTHSPYWPETGYRRHHHHQ
jgi:hypothetical protein